MNAPQRLNPDFRTLFESGPGLYLVLECDAPRYTIAAVSDLYARTTMTRRENILGRGLFEVFPGNPDDPEGTGVQNLTASLQRVISQRVPDAVGLQKYDIRRPAEEGGGFEERWWSTINSPVFGADGELVLIIHRVEDVTEFVLLKQKGAEQQKLTAELKTQTERMEAEVFLRGREIEEFSRRLWRANEEITRLYEKTKELDQLKSQFFSNISHELRTPLTLILGPTERMLAAPETMDRARRDLEVIARNARTLERRVDDLLDVAQLEAGRMKPDYAKTDLARLVRFVAGHFDVLAGENGIDYALDSPQVLWADVDSEKLKRVFFNLLSNAFKFTPRGGRVRITLQVQNETRAVVEVADSGPGIPVDQRELAFERFRQLEGGATRRFGGTGLGLAIARDLVALHQGSISIGEAPEGGALLSVEVPRTAPAEAAVRPAAAEPEVGPSRQKLEQEVEELRKLTTAAPQSAAPERAAAPADASLVLIVEDNPEMNRFIAENLISRYRVITAFDGKDGLAQALASTPDLVLTDIMMPEMSGEDLVYQIRKHEPLASMPILIVTAKADDALRLKLLREGAQDYLTKPFCAEELLARVTNLVARKRAEAEQQRIQHQQKFLADVGAVLASSLEYEDTLASIARLALHELADCVIVDVIGEGNQLRRLKVVHRDPAKASLCERLERIQIERRRPHLASKVLDTKQPILMRDVDADYVDSIAQSEEHLEALRELDPRSLLAVPLVAHEQLLGSVLFVSSLPARRYGTSDLYLAQELAFRAALAIENARLYETAHRATQTRDEVLGVVAHDLRNPLGTILMQAELLRRPGAEPDRRATKPAEVIERASTRMSRLIQDLLDVTRMEAGRLSIEPARVPAAQVVFECVEAQKPVAASASLELELDLARDVPEVWVDRDRLFQVFENLIGNAVKFTQAGGRITAGAAPRKGEVLFWVRDTGAGIVAGNLPHLFDRFWQAQKDGRRGAGLGLPIAKGIILAHGGRIWVESAPGRGSTFFFTIPIAARAEEWRQQSTPSGA